MAALKRFLPWVIAVAVVAGAVVFYLRYRAAHAPPPVEYKTQEIGKRKIVGRVTASGTLQATVTVQVGTQVSGRVAKLFKDFNSPVKKGEMVAKIDPQLFEAALQQANANYASAKAALVKAQAQARDAELQEARTKALNQQSLASAADLQAADTNVAVSRASVDVAQASVQQAQASLNQAHVNLEYTNIVSPIDGVVISRSVDVGQTVAASLQAPTIFTIAEDLRKMQVNTNVAEGDVGRLAQGQEATFTVDAFPGQHFRGKISQIRNAATSVQNVVTYDAVIDVDNSDLRLRPGMTANVTVVYAERDDVLAVPNTALRFRPPPEANVSAPGAPGASRGSRRSGGGAGAGAGAGGSAAGAAGGGEGSGGGHRGGRQRGGAGGAGGEGSGDAGAGADAGAPTDLASDDEALPRTVWLLRAGQPEPATVKLGLSDGTWTEVTSGMKEGDVAIIDAVVNGKSAAAAAGATTPPRMGRMF